MTAYITYTIRYLNNIFEMGLQYVVALRQEKYNVNRPLESYIN